VTGEAPEPAPVQVLERPGTVFPRQQPDAAGLGTGAVSPHLETGQLVDLRAPDLIPDPTMTATVATEEGERRPGQVDPT